MKPTAFISDPDIVTSPTWSFLIDISKITEVVILYVAFFLDSSIFTSITLIESHMPLSIYFVLSTSKLYSPKNIIILNNLVEKNQIFFQYPFAFI